MNNILAIVPSAGIGQRFDSDIPKQYQDLDGKSIIEHSIQPFIDSNLISKILIPVASNDEYIKKQSFYGDSKITIVKGGSSRAESVLNGLKNKEVSGFDFVIVHDAARPNVTEDDISNIYNEILSTKSDCSIFYMPIVDSLKEISKEKDITKDKSKFYLVQTPQISNLTKLKSALEALLDRGINVPDESFAMDSINAKISKIRGRSSNIKITHKDDLDLLRKFSTRTGSGYDLHTYKKGKGILIGGYLLECDYEIEAHSDGDVLLHSIADSILGASALGDIGIFFPDSDKQNRGLNSKVIIDFCLNKIKDLKMEIYNVDATIICESPKISPHRNDILDSLSIILGLPKSKIGLKATTAEKVGIIGKNKAISVQSTVNLREIVWRFY